MGSYSIQQQKTGLITGLTARDLLEKIQIANVGITWNSIQIISDGEGVHAFIMWTETEDYINE